MIMGYLKERIKHAVRFRHKRGYGVHSPFMFNLILNVIRDKEKQFTYPEILEQADILTSRERKVFRLLSRLIRYLKVKQVICLGSSAGILTEYLSEAYPEACIMANTSQPLLQADFVYIGRNAKRYMSGNLDFPDEEVYPKYIVIADIYKHDLNGRLWSQYRDRATVSVDMMWYGLLFFDNRIQRGKYNLII